MYITSVFIFSISNKFLFDCFRQTKIHNIGARLVGVDKIGNKYYEKLDTQYGQCFFISPLLMLFLL